MIESNTTSRKSITSTADTPDPTQILSLKSKITDQEEQIETLKKKRRVDLEKLREFDSIKLQLGEVMLFQTSFLFSTFLL